MANDFDIEKTISVPEEIEYTKEQLRRIKNKIRKSKSKYEKRNKEILAFYNEHPELIRIEGGVQIIDPDIERQKEKLEKEKIKESPETSLPTFKEPYVYDLSHVTGENIEDIDLDKLEKEWISWCRTARKDKRYNYIDCDFLYIWLDNYIKSNNIRIIEKHIEYGPGHYALRNDGLIENTGIILDVNDFILHSSNNGIIQYTYEYFNDNRSNSVNKKEQRCGDKSNRMIDIIHIYTGLFWHMGIRDEKMMFIHVLWMMMKTCNLKSWLYEDIRDIQNEDGDLIYSKDKQDHNYFSPKTLHTMIVKYMERNYKPVPKPGCNKKHRFQKLYLEPGFEEEGRTNYAYDKRNVYADKIRKAIKHLEELGETINEETVFYETNRITTINKRKFREIEKEFNIEMTRVVKKQERSKWHEMVRNGAKYEEVIKEFPEVSKDAYKKAKYRLKNKL